VRHRDAGVNARGHHLFPLDQPPQRLLDRGQGADLKQIAGKASAGQRQT